MMPEVERWVELGRGKGKKEQGGAGKVSHKQKERREEANKPHSVSDGQTDRASSEAQVMLGLPQKEGAAHHTASPRRPRHTPPLTSEGSHCACTHMRMYLAQPYVKCPLQLRNPPTKWTGFPRPLPKRWEVHKDAGAPASGTCDM